MSARRLLLLHGMDRGVDVSLRTLLHLRLGYFQCVEQPGHGGATKALEIGWCLLASCFPALDNVFDGWNGETGFMNELDAFTENCFKEIGHGRWKRKGVIGTTAFLIATCFAPSFD